MTTRSMPAAWQKSASAVTPSGVLAKRSNTPVDPAKASSQSFEISTPQMRCITITFLVRTIGKPNDCSLVRENSDGPRLTNGCNLRGDGRHRCHTGVGGHPPRCLVASSRTANTVSRYNGGYQPLH